MNCQTVVALFGTQPTIKYGHQWKL